MSEDVVMGNISGLWETIHAFMYFYIGCNIMDYSLEVVPVLECFG